MTNGGVNNSGGGGSGWGSAPSGSNAGSSSGWGVAPPPNPTATAAWGTDGTISRRMTRTYWRITARVPAEK